MSERIAQLYVELSARTDKLEAGLKASHGQLGKFKGGLNEAVKGLTGFDAASIGTAAIVGGLAAGLKYAVGQAMEAEVAMAATEAVIKSTGGAAGLTAEQVADMAGNLSVMTGIQDDVIQSGQNMLLTFKEIKGDNFERATIAMNDMAVAMNSGSLEGLDLKGTAIQLGKALNDPIKGLTALSRVGVSFTQAQKDAIKEMVAMNDIAGAQAIILGELETEFGGAAEAAGETLAGDLAKAKNAVSELAEEIGTDLLPVLADAAEAFTLLVQWDDLLTNAFEEQRQNLLGLDLSYEDYADQLINAAVLSNKLTGSQGELVKMYVRGDDALRQGGIISAREFAEAIGLAERDVYDFRNELSEAEMVTLRFGTALDSSGKNALVAKDNGFEPAGKSLADMAEAGKSAGEHLSTVALVTADAATQTDAYATAAANAAAAQASAQQSLQDRATGFYDLAVALKDATLGEIAQTQIGNLQELMEKGLLTEEQYEQGWQAIGLAYGLVTPQSIAMAKATDELTFLLGAGRISQEDFNEAIGAMPAAAADGVVSMDELGVAVAEGPATEFAGARDRAEEFEGVLDRLDGRTVTNTVVTDYVTHGIPTGGPIGAPGPEIIANAEGGDYWVTGPTLFLAGEAGPERATFTPEGQAGGGGPITINVYPAAGTNGEQLAQQLRRAIQSGAGLTGS